MKTGIIVARFQTSYLHEGHVKLIRHVQELNDRVIIFLGTNPTKLTHSNPLSFEAREIMVKQDFPTVEVFPLPDHKYDDVWNQNLDKCIEQLCIDENVILYGDRESFIQQYNGKYRKEYSNTTVHGISATKIRIGNHMSVPNDKQARAGAIWASAYKYPVSYQAVDIAILHTNKKEILLGRKEGEEKYRFVGGFIDVTDESLESGAKREVMEECGNIETANYRYIESFRIDDWRYRKEKDKIMTAFFVADYIFGHVIASDDIKELKWFNIGLLSENDFEKEHAILYNSLINYFIKKK